MAKNLRLLVTEDCNRDCRFCCNKNFDLSSLMVVTEFSGYEEVILTGGEPLLYPEFMGWLIRHIKKANWVPVYVFTAKLDDISPALSVLDLADGMTVTLHDPSDVDDFASFHHAVVRTLRWPRKSLRLKVFNHIKVDPMKLAE